MIRSPTERPTVNPFDGIDLGARPKPPRDEELTGKQRLFAEAYAAGVPPATAWRQAGYVSQYETERAMRPGVVALVAQLQAEHAQRNKVTVDKLLLELEEARHAAMKLCQISAAITAVMGKAKLMGFLVDRVQSQQDINLVVSKAVRNPTDKASLTVDEWVELYQPPMKLVN